VDVGLDNGAPCRDDDEDKPVSGCPKTPGREEPANAQIRESEETAADQAGNESGCLAFHRS